MSAGGGELQGFRRKENPKTSHVSFEHWRDSDHDYLVLAVAMACWGATSQRPRRTTRIIRQGRTVPEYTKIAVCASGPDGRHSCCRIRRPVGGLDRRRKS